MNRARTALDASQTQRWLSQWWGEDSHVPVVREIVIETTSLDPTALEADARFQALRGRTSLLHRALQFIAMRWLEAQPASCSPRDRRFEVRPSPQIYIPSEELLKVDADFEIVTPRLLTKPRILKPQERFDCTRGTVLIADVIGRGALIEVGDVWAANLLEPLAAELVNRTIWIPYPAGVDRHAPQAWLTCAQKIPALSVTLETVAYPSTTV